MAPDRSRPKSPQPWEITWGDINSPDVLGFFCLMRSTTDARIWLAQNQRGSDDNTVTSDDGRSKALQFHGAVWYHAFDVMSPCYLADVADVAARGSGEEMILLAVHLYCGVRCTLNRPLAFRILETMASTHLQKDVDVAQPLSSEDAHGRAALCVCRASALLCAMYRRKYEGGGRLRDLCRALQHGERAAALGFWTSAQYLAARDYRRLVKPAISSDVLRSSHYDRWLATLSEDDVEYALFMASCSTMLAIFDYVRQQYENESPPPKERLPCSRPGCPVSSWQHSELKRCMGLCDTLEKPQYCSKACQKADWARHKPFCRRVPAEGENLAFTSFSGELVNLDLQGMTIREAASARLTVRLYQAFRKRVVECASTDFQQFMVAAESAFRDGTPTVRYLIRSIELLPLLGSVPTSVVSR